MTSAAIQNTPIEAKKPQYPVIENSAIEQKKQQLETLFKHIHQQRMQDIPVINDKLEVTGVGFQQWQNSFLGILVTPWFMNIILLPSDSENWDDITILSQQTHIFPSGRYQFLMNFEPDIGRYQTCSLFSPMFEFADNDAAVETAEHAIKAIMDSDNVDEQDIDEKQIERIWNGEDDDSELNDNTATQKKRPSISEKLEKPISRRELLRGSFLKDED